MGDAGDMGDEGDGRSKTVRRLVGKPRIWMGVVWCCIGLAWLLFAAFDGGAVSRIVIGLGWLLIGVVNTLIAVYDRKNQRGFYQTAAPPRAN
jgi:uncharacterized membrane protein HdeD (DUF308 family)